MRKASFLKFNRVLNPHCCPAIEEYAAFDTINKMIQFFFENDVDEIRIMEPTVSRLKIFDYFFPIGVCSEGDE
jgi:hypothetical protein